MHPSVPPSIRVVVVLAAIASLLAFPALTSAAPKGSGVAFDVRALIQKVSTNQAAAFEVSAVNNGSASLTHATLVPEVTGGALATLPAGCGGTPVTCDLGTLSSGDSRTLVFVVTAGQSAGSTAFTATLLVDAGGNNPSVDEFMKTATVAVSNSPTFFGRWQSAGGPFGGSVGGGHQTATATVPAVGFAYRGTIEEVTGPVCGIAGIGNGVAMSLADNEPVDPFITVTITYDAEARGNRTPGNVNVIHDGNCDQPLVSGCDSAGCFNARWEGNGRNKLLVVEALLPHNGIVKGF